MRKQIVVTIVTIACLPLLSGCMATHTLHNSKIGVRTERLSSFRQAVQVDNTIMVEGDATIYYGDSQQKDVCRSRSVDVPHMLSIDLSKPKMYNRYPFEILDCPLPPTAAAGVQIPLIAMPTRAYDRKRTEAFIASTNNVAVYHNGFAVYLMRKSEVGPRHPEDIQYVCAEMYHVWWRPIVILPAYPVAIVFDAVTSPVQFMIALDRISKIGQ